MVGENYLRPLRESLVDGTIDSKETLVKKYGNETLDGTLLISDYVCLCKAISEQIKVQDRESFDNIVKKLKINPSDIGWKVSLILTTILNGRDPDKLNPVGIAEDINQSESEVIDVIGLLYPLMIELAKIEIVYDALKNSCGGTGTWCKCGFQTAGGICNECACRGSNKPFVGSHAFFIYMREKNPTVIGKFIELNVYPLLNKTGKINSKEILDAIYNLQCTGKYQLE